MNVTDENRSWLNAVSDNSASNDDELDTNITQNSFFSRGKDDRSHKKIINILKSTVHEGLNEDYGTLEKTVEAILKKIGYSRDSTDISERFESLILSGEDDTQIRQVLSSKTYEDPHNVTEIPHLPRGMSQNNLPCTGNADRVHLYANSKYRTTPNERTTTRTYSTSSTILNTCVNDCINLVLSAEFLMDEGAIAFSLPDNNNAIALKHWCHALETVDHACTPILKAKILSNISCLLSASNHEHDALVFAKTAWALTLNYLRCVPDGKRSYWANFVRSSLKIDTHTVQKLNQFVCKVNSGSHGGVVSAFTVPDKHASGASIVSWALQLTINLGNRYYKLGRVDKAAKYYILSKIISESIIEDVLNSYKSNKNTKLNSRSSLSIYKPLGQQINPVIRSFQRLHHTKQGSMGSLRSKNSCSSSLSGINHKNDLGACVNLNYVLFQALLCNAKSLSYLGVCYTSIPSLKSKSLPLHLEAESRVMRLLSLVSLELDSNSSENPPFALVESKLACSCILLNLSLAYKKENKRSLAAIYRDLCIKTHQDYTNLLLSFYSSVRMNPSGMR